MAIQTTDVTTLLNFLDDSDLSEYTTGTAVIPATGKTFCIVGGEHGANADGTLGYGTPVTTGVTWGSPIAEVASTNNVALRLYEGTVDTPGTVATTVTFPDIQDQCSVDIINIDSSETTKNIKTIVQGSGTAIALTLDNTASVNSGVFLYTAVEGVADFTEGSAQTPMPGVGGGTVDKTAVYMFGQYNLDGVNALDGTLNTARGSVSIGFEVTAATSETETLMTLLLEEANPTTVVAATALVDGTRYEILDPGTTDFTTVGAADSVAGTRFRASGAPAIGTGTTYQVDPVICESTNFALGVTAYVLRGGTVSEQATNIRSGTIEPSSEITLYCTYPNGDPVLGDSDAVVFFYDNAIGDIKSVTGGIPLATGSYTGDTCS